MIGASLSEPHSSEDNPEVWCLSVRLSVYVRQTRQSTHARTLKHVCNKVRMRAHGNTLTAARLQVPARATEQLKSVKLGLPTGEEMTEEEGHRYSPVPTTFK